MKSAKPKIQILPSLLAANVGRLEEACLLAEKSGADGLHLDIMDGHFVPNLSMGPEVSRMARRTVKLPLSVHLMVTRPDIFVGQIFISSVLPKIAEIRQRVPTLDLSVDGGINQETAEESAAYGINIFIAGTFLYNADNMTTETEGARLWLSFRPFASDFRR